MLELENALVPPHHQLHYTLTTALALCLFALFAVSRLDAVLPFPNVLGSTTFTN